MSTKLAEAAKQEGASAFSRCFGKTIYDVLLNDALCDELLTLWDCETLEALRAHVADTGNRPAAQSYLQEVCTQIGEQRSQAMTARPAQPAPPGL